jgi:hypothetical protein
VFGGPIVSRRMKPASGNGEPIAKALRRATFMWQDRHEVFPQLGGFAGRLRSHLPRLTPSCDPALQRR